MNVHSGVVSIALVLFLGDLLLFDTLGSILFEFLVLLHDLALAALALSTSSGTISKKNTLLAFCFVLHWVNKLLQ